MHAKGKEAAGTPEARGLGMRHQQKPKLAMRVAGVIQKTVSSNLAKPPTSLAGAHPCKRFVFCNLHTAIPLPFMRQMRRTIQPQGSGRDLHACAELEALQGLHSLSRMSAAGSGR